MFHGLNNSFLYATQQLVCTFRNQASEGITSRGTGFWVKNRRDIGCLVTNRHVLDVSYGKPEFEGYKLSQLKILGKGLKPGSDRPDIDRRFNIIDLDVKFSQDERNDVACLINPRVMVLDGSDDATVDYFIPHEILASKTDLDELVSVCDFLAYVGFPAWHDKRQQRPILRTGTVSSDPRYDYSWSNEYQGECIAFEAFSSDGSSGSPVFALQKALKPGENITIPGYRELKLIGVNAGYLGSEDMAHSGISYMYKSSAILDIIDA